MNRFLGFAIIILTLVSCNVGFPPAEGGTVLLSFNDGVTTRSILPSKSMDIDRYDIHGLHEDGDVFNELDVAAGSSVVITDLVAGLWDITVNGKNAAGDIIGQGTTQTIVNQSTQVTANVTVTPIVGQGTLDMDINWTAAADALMVNPGVASQLLSYTGVFTDLTYIVDQVANTAHYDGLHNHGYYTLLTRFIDTVDNGDGTFTVTTVAGNAEVVRIAAGDTSHGSYTYDNVNTGALGDVEIIISPELGDPLVFTIALSPNTTALDWSNNDSVTLTASTVSTTDLVSYKWYINGSEVSAGSNTLVVNARDYPRPATGQTVFLNVAVVGFSNAGTRGGSTAVNMTVVR